MIGRIIHQNKYVRYLKKLNNKYFDKVTFELTINNYKMSHPDCILEEVNPINNQKQVKQDEQIEEICTSDYHVDNCECFVKQEQKIKELQTELERQRKIQEEKKKQKLAVEQQKENELKAQKQKEKEQAQKVKQQQQQKEKEAKMEGLRIKINELSRLANEQKLIADKKYKEASEANQLYYKFYSEYQNHLYQYELMTNTNYSYSDDILIPNLFNIIFNPKIKF